MQDDLAQVFHANLVDFLVFGVLGILEYFLVLTVVWLAASLLGIPLGGGLALIAAAIIVGATILTGGMPAGDT